MGRLRFLFQLIGFLGSTVLWGQSGPAGVSTATNTVFWFRADKNVVHDGSDNVTTWSDQLNGHDATNLIAGTNPTYNGTAGIGANSMPGIQFNTASSEYLGLLDDGDINTSAITNRTFVIVFKTGSDVTSLQYLYDQGDANDGIEVYIQSGNLSAGIYSSSTNYSLTSSSTLTANTSYIAAFTFDGGSTGMELFLNGTSEDVDNLVAASIASHNGIRIGSDVSETNNFTGHIAELVYYGITLNDGELTVVTNFLSEQYGISISEDFYTTAGSAYGYQLTGISRTNSSEHNASSGRGGSLYLAENSGDPLSDDEHVFAGHNNDNLSVTSADMSGLSGFDRFNRIWYFEKTGSPGLQVEFDVVEAGFSTPTDANDYSLIMRSGTSGDFSEVTATKSLNGDRVRFVLADANFSAAYYSLGFPSSKKRWYALNSGDWDDPNTWTLDPAGVSFNNPDNLTPSTSSTASIDEVYIRSGKTVTLTNDADISTAMQMLTVDGTLDFGNTSGHSTIASLFGSGTVKFSGYDHDANALTPNITNLPTISDATHFVSQNQGEGTFEVYGSEDVEIGSGDLGTFFDLAINLTSASDDELVVLTDLTINGDLLVNSGNFQINDATDDVKRTIVVSGDVTVESGGKVSVGTGDPTASAGEPADDAFYTSFHLLQIYGDFTNNGTVRFTNQTKPHFDDHTDQGAVTVEFTGASDNTATLNGVTDFYQLHINKGTDQTYVLTINSADSLYFGLYGRNNGAVTNLASTPNPTYAARNWWIQNGTLKLTGDLLVPSLTEQPGSGGGTDDNHAFIPANGALWIAGNNVDVRQSSTDQTRFDGVTNSPERTQLVVFGTFRISAGQFLSERSAPVQYDDSNSGSIIIEGGYTEFTQIRPITGGQGGTPSYYQSGGTVKFIGTTIGAENQTTGGGELSGTDMGTFEFGEPNSSFTMTGGQMIFKDVRVGQGGINGINIGSKAGNYSVTGGTITIDVASGETDPADPFEISSTTYFYNLSISDTDGDWVDMQSDLEITNDLIITNSSTLDMNGYDLTVGRNFSVASGTTYTQGGNSTLTLNGDAEQFIYLDGTITSSFYNVVASGTGLKTLQTGDMTVSNQLTIEEGSSINDGGNTLYINGDISNMGTHASDPGGEMQVTSGSATHSISGEGTFGNLTLNDASYETNVSDDIIITDTLTFSQDGVLHIDVNSLTMYGANAVISGAGSSRYISTAGNSSDGGLILFIDDEDSDGAETVTFHIGTDANAVARYTPLTASFSSVTDSGYVQLSVADKDLPTTDATGGDILSYYWRVRYSGFGTVPKVSSYVFTHDASDEDGANVNSWRSGKVLDFAPYTRSTENTYNKTANTLTFTNGGTPFDLELASYTCGQSNRFNGQPDVYYSKNDGNFNTASVWSKNAADGSGSAEVPGVGAIVIIQHGINDTGAAHRINVYSSIADLGAVYFDHDFSGYPTPTSEDIPRLQFMISGTFDIGNVSGTGMVSFDAGNDPTVNGDFGEFASSPDSYYLYFNGPATLDHVPTPIPNLMVESATYTIDQAVDINFDLIVQGDGTVLPVQDMNIAGDLVLGVWVGGTFQFPSQATPITVTVGGNIDFTNDPFSNPSDRNLIAGSGSSQNVEHSLILKGDIIHGDENNHDIDLWVSNSLERVVLNLEGTSNNQYSRTSTSEPELYRVVVNKGTDQTWQFAFNESFTLNGSTNGSTKALELQNGTLVLDDTGIDIDLTTGGADFEIPAEAGLQVFRGTVNASGTDTGIFLDGLLRADNSGIVDLDGGSNNYIEYSVSGNATLEIAGSAQVVVGGQIRKSEFNNYGVLNYSQDGTSTLIVGNATGGSPATNRSMFEVSGTGSSFNWQAGTIIIANDFSTSGVPSVYLDPDGTPTISAGTTLQMGNGNTVSGSSQMSIKSFATLANVLVDNAGGSGNYPYVTLLSLPLTLLEDLEIESNTTFDANGLALVLGGDMINTSGTGFVSGSNTVTFNGGGLQQITGDGTTFYNLTYSGSSTLQLASGTSIEIDGQFRIASGTFDDNNNDVLLEGDIYNVAVYTNSNGSPSNRGLVFAGSAIAQNINASGTYSRLHIENALGVTVNNNITVNQLIALDGAVLDILGNQLTMGEDAIFADSTGSGYSVTNMVETRRSFTDAGIVKVYNGTAASPFTYPIGSDSKYTPVVITLAQNSQSAATISIRAADEPHPSVVEDVDNPEFVDVDNVLQYYWEVTSSGMTDFIGSLEFTYTGYDAFVTSPFTLEDYHTARLLPDESDNWNKLPTGFKYMAQDGENTIHFDLSTASADTEIGGDYTAGIEAAIPDQIQTISSVVSSGNWTSGASWNTGTVPVGAIVHVLSGDTITMDANGQVVFKTIIDGVLVVGASINQRLGKVSGNGTLGIESGSLPAGVYDEFMDCASGGTIDFMGSGSYTLPSTVTDIRNLKISGGGTKSFPNTDITICGDLEIDDASALANTQNRSITIQGDVLLTNGTLDIGTNASVVIEGNCTIETGSLDIGNSTLTVYGSLIVNGGSVDLGASGVLNVDTHLTLAGGTINGANSSTINLGGNLSRSSGTFAVSSTTTTIELNGTGNQSIQGDFTGSNAFKHLTINKSAGIATIVDAGNNDVDIAGILTLTSGRITTSSSNVLTITSAGSVSGGSSSSFVNGPLTKSSLGAGQSFTFYVGAGAEYALCGVENVATGGQDWTAEFFGSNTNSSQTINTTENPSYGEMVDITTNGSWVVSSSGSNSANVVLGIQSHLDVNNINDVRVAIYDGPVSGEWVNLGASQSGTESDGTVTSLTVAGFSTHTFSLGGVNETALPVELVSFIAEVQHKEVLLKWVTASETGNDYFEIQRAEEDGAFITIGVQSGMGDSKSVINYRFLDLDAVSGISYYRLKQVDYDSKFEYSEIISVYIQPEVKEVSVKLYPTIVTNGFINLNISEVPENARVAVRVLDLLGSEHYSETCVPHYGEVNERISLSIAPGMYLAIVSVDGRETIHRFIVK